MAVRKDVDHRCIGKLRQVLNVYANPMHVPVQQVAGLKVAHKGAKDAKTRVRQIRIIMNVMRR